MKISYDPDAGITTFIGPGGFTQLHTEEVTARAIATALGVEFEIRPVIVRA